MQVLDRIRRYVHQHALFRADTRLIVALSGGSDSVALTVLLRELDAAGDVRLVGAAHFNHQLRDGADRDEQFAASLARSLDIPFAVDRADVRARARGERRSLETAAREARYEFFERARRQFEADKVALGHTRDDQAETFLLRLVRGAGPRGLAAMYPRRGTIVRPILDCRRMELRVYLDERRIAYVEDETNRDVRIPRNRIRAELIPLLAARFNPAIVDALAHEAELARETWEWLASAADELSGERVGSLFRTAIPKTTPDPFCGELDVAWLKAAPAPLRRLIVWSAMNEIAGGRPVTFRHVQTALQLLERDRGAVDAPGQRVERIDSRLVLTGRPADTVGRWAPENVFWYPLSIPGEVQLAEASCIVSAELRVDTRFGGPGTDNEGPSTSGRGPLALVRGDLCRGALAVRNRRPGDRFRPIGVGGRKKLQDYFVDRKVALARRDRVPLVVDQSDRIVWVAGYGIDEAFRVTDASQSVLLLKLKLLGGPA